MDRKKRVLKKLTALNKETNLSFILIWKAHISTPQQKIMVDDVENIYFRYVVMCMYK